MCFLYNPKTNVDQKVLSSDLKSFESRGQITLIKKSYVFNGFKSKINTEISNHFQY